MFSSRVSVVMFKNWDILRPTIYFVGDSSILFINYSSIRYFSSSSYSFLGVKFNWFYKEIYFKLCNFTSLFSVYAYICGVKVKFGLCCDLIGDLKGELPFLGLPISSINQGWLKDYYELSLLFLLKTRSKKSLADFVISISKVYSPFRIHIIVSFSY